VATALSWLLVLLVLSFQQPKMALPAQYAHQASSDPFAGTVLPDAADTEFWRSFEDPQLSALVSLALDANKDCESRWRATTAPTHYCDGRSSISSPPSRRMR